MKVRWKLLLTGLSIFVAIFILQFLFQNIFFENYYEGEKKKFLVSKIDEYEKVALTGKEGIKKLKEMEKQGSILVYFNEYLEEIEGSFNQGGSVDLKLVDDSMKTFNGYGALIGDSFKVGDKVKIQAREFEDGYTLIESVRNLEDKSEQDEIIYSNYSSNGKGEVKVYEGVIKGLVIEESHIEELKSAAVEYIYYRDEGDFFPGNFIFTYENKDYVLSIKYADRGFIVGVTPLEKSSEIISIMNKFNLYIIGLSLVILYLVVILFSKKLTEPLVKMRDKAKEISKLNFDYDLQLNTGDELQELSESLEEIALNLNKNITQLNQANNQLKKEYEDRLNMEKSQKNLLMNISHDLKTPLTVVKGYMKGIKAGIYKEDSIIDKSIQAVDEITETIKNMLELTRLKGDIKDVEKEIFPIDEVMYQCIDSIKEIFRNKDQKLIFDIEDDAFIEMNKKDFIQMFENIISNANHYSPENAEIEISLKEIQNEYYLRITNGESSIPEDEINKVFEPFYKVEKARNAGSGNGLGLSIVKEILEKHDLKYSIENIDGAVQFLIVFTKKEW